MAEVQVIDPMDTQYQLLGQVAKPVMEQSTDPNSYNALAVPGNPQDVAGRTRYLQRLLALFSASCSGSFQGGEMQTLLTSLMPTLPDPERYPEQFVDMIRGKCHGFFEMLRCMVVLQGSKTGATKQQVQDAAARLGAPVLDEGMPKSLNSLGYEQREGAMCARVGDLKELTKELRVLPEIKAANQQLYPQVMGRYQTAGFRIEFIQVTNAYTTGVERILATAKFINPDFIQAQWFNALLTNLRNLEASRDAKSLLPQLAQGLRQAADAAAFTSLIDGFGKTGGTTTGAGAPN